MNNLKVTEVINLSLDIINIINKYNTCIISYVMLNDLKPIYSPIHKRILFDKNSIKKFILEIASMYQPEFSGDIVELKEWRKKYPNWKDDSSYYFTGYKGYSSPFNENHAENISKRLIKNRYHVVNRINKYYVVAFSINYSLFYVYSKDYNPEIIDWNFGDKWIEDDVKIEKVKNGEFRGEILTDNENPVITLMSNLLN
jgi:hypothetical protein